MMLIFDVMQHRIIDSIAPGATLSMAEFTKHVICRIFFTSHSIVTSNPVALRRLGTGKVAQSRCARFRMHSYGLRSKFTNGFYSCL